MLQLIGLRPFVDKRGRARKKPAFETRNLGFASIEDVFQEDKVREQLGKLHEHEHYDLYFTVADCHDPENNKYRVFKEQWCIHFDIDGIIREEAEKVARLACEAIAVEYEKTGVIFSGNGVQLFVRTHYPIVTPTFFDEARSSYNVLLNRIAEKLRANDTKGNVDPSVWSTARLMRLPWTLNKKIPDSPIMARVLQANILPQDFDLVAEAGLPPGEEIHDECLLTYGPVDTPAVLSGCNFLKHCKDSPEEVTEPQWYAMLSITSRLEDGDKISHEYSEGHPEYNYDETSIKIEQAKERAGPRTCGNISYLFGGCQSCPNYGKVKSPITIKGPAFISTKDLGFRHQVLKGGVLIPGKPHYDDLLKYYDLNNEYMSLDGEIKVFNGTHYVEKTRLEIHGWMYNIVRPSPSVTEMDEFYGRLRATKLRRREEVTAGSDGYLNFKNGVLRLSDHALLKHDSKYGFNYVIPYDYNRYATAPLFNKFLGEIFAGNIDTIKLIKEYIGYCVSDDPCWAQKCLFLYGEGANGKSVLLETVGALVGGENHSAVPVQDFGRTNSLAKLVGKLFNYSEEASADALFKSETFKTIVVGGVISYKKLYQDEYEAPIKTKLIVSSNQAPRSTDKSYGLLRRLIIVHMPVTITEEQNDPYLKSKLMSELPGILNECVSAYLEAKVRGGFTTPKAVEIALESFKYENDTVYAFLKYEGISVAGGSDDRKEFKTFQELYDMYRNYCHDAGITKIITRRAFVIDLKRILGVADVSRRGGRRDRDRGLEVFMNVHIGEEY